MAQELSIELPIPATAPPVASEALQGQSASIDFPPPKAAPQPVNHDGQSLQGVNQVEFGQKASEDDEVQFVFAVPRRRKRKRKRFEFSYSPSMLNQCSVPPTDPPPKPDSATMLDPLRRQSLGVLKQLESCHIGTRESKDYVVRRNSLPIAPSATVSLPKGHASWLPNSSYGAVQAVQHSSHSTSIPWWNESRSLTQTNTANLPDWRPLQMDNSVSKKRRREDELTTGQAQRLSQSSQISPRTSPVSTLPSIESSARDSVIDTSEMLWTPDMPSLSGNQPSNLPMFNSWADFDWNAFDRLGTSHCEPPPVHQTIPMNHTVPSTQKPANLLYQPRVEQSKSRNTWQQNISRVPAPQAPYRPIFKSSQTSQRFQTSLHQPRHQQSVSPRSTMPMKATIPSFQQPAALSRNFNGNPPNLSSPHPSLQPQRKQTTVSPSQTQTIPQSLQVASSDLMRKPSLYKIPAWPSPLEVRPPQMHMMTSQFQARPPNSNPDRSAGSQSGMNFGTLRQPSNSMPPERQSSRNFDDTPHSRGMNPAGSTHAISVAKINTFELPQARTGRKHCPNLIVDIAETCQDLFPFAEVAERHSVPIKKVFDIFSAIIQLPLLRNADDRRRHGSLGKQRMREYRDARKAMEKAQEAERKAQMKAMKARVDEAGEKGVGQPNASGLLKTAILNNASQTGANP